MVLKERRQGDVIRRKIIEAFENDPRIPGAIVIEDMMVRKIDLEIGFAKSVERKMIVEQLVLAVKFNKTRIIILGNANTQKTIIEAQRQVQASIILANGTRQALELIAQAFGGDRTQALEFYYYMETLKSLADKGKITVILAPFGSGQPVYVIPFGD